MLKKIGGGVEVVKLHRILWIQTEHYKFLYEKWTKDMYPTTVKHGTGMDFKIRYAA